MKKLENICKTHNKRHRKPTKTTPKTLNNTIKINKHCSKKKIIAMQLISNGYKQK